MENGTVLRSPNPAPGPNKTAIPRNPRTPRTTPMSIPENRRIRSITSPMICTIFRLYSSPIRPDQKGIVPNSNVTKATAMTREASPFLMVSEVAWKICFSEMTPHRKKPSAIIQMTQKSGILIWNVAFPLFRYIKDRRMLCQERAKKRSKLRSDVATERMF